MPEEAIWEQREDETPRKYKYFNEYLQLTTPRTIPKLQDRLEKSSDFSKVPTEYTLYKYSSDFDWKIRAEAYDLNEIEIERQELEKQRLERIKKRLEQNADEEDKIHERIMEVLNHPEFKGNVSKFAYAASELSKAKKNATESQRLDYGDPTIIEKSEVNADIKTDKAEKVKNLFEEAKKGNDNNVS